MPLEKHCETGLLPEENSQSVLVFFVPSLILRLKAGGGQMVRTPWSFLHAKHVMTSKGSNARPIKGFTDYFLFEPKKT